MFAYACGGCSGLFTVRYLTVVRGATRARGQLRANANADPNAPNARTVL